MLLAVVALEITPAAFHRGLLLLVVVRREVQPRFLLLQLPTQAVAVAVADIPLLTYMLVQQAAPASLFFATQSLFRP
jgi:hypothetical protein